MRVKIGENVGAGSSSVAEDISVYDERKKLLKAVYQKWELKLLKQTEFYHTR